MQNQKMTEKEFYIFNIIKEYDVFGIFIEEIVKINIDINKNCTRKILDKFIKNKTIINTPLGYMFLDDKI